MQNSPMFFNDNICREPVTILPPIKKSPSFICCKWVDIGSFIFSLKFVSSTAADLFFLKLISFPSGYLRPAAANHI